MPLKIVNLTQTVRKFPEIFADYGVQNFSKKKLLDNNDDELTWAAGKSAIRSLCKLGLSQFRNEFRNWVSLDSLDSHQSRQSKQQIQAGIKIEIGSRSSIHGTLSTNPGQNEK